MHWLRSKLAAAHCVACAPPSTKGSSSAGPRGQGHSAWVLLSQRAPSESSTTAQPSRDSTPSTQCESFTCGACAQASDCGCATRSSVRTAPCSEPAAGAPGRHVAPVARTSTLSVAAERPAAAGAAAAS